MSYQSESASSFHTTSVFCQYILRPWKKLHHWVYFSESTWWACVFVAEIELVFLFVFIQLRSEMPHALLWSWVTGFLLMLQKVPFTLSGSLTSIAGLIDKTNQQCVDIWYSEKAQGRGHGKLKIEVTGAERWVVPDSSGCVLDINPDLKLDLLISPKKNKIPVCKMFWFGSYEEILDIAYHSVGW